jgi:hypothetical protein
MWDLQAQQAEPEALEEDLQDGQIPAQ